MYWPNDIDGEVFRKLESHGFDFSDEHEIEINIDFEQWPLSDDTIQTIKQLYPGCQFIDPDEEDIANGELNGYVVFYVTEKLTYDFIVNLQKDISQQVKPFGGWCDSWGVMSH